MPMPEPDGWRLVMRSRVIDKGLLRLGREDEALIRMESMRSMLLMSMYLGLEKIRSCQEGGDLRLV